MSGAVNKSNKQAPDTFHQHIMTITKAINHTIQQPTTQKLLTSKLLSNTHKYLTCLQIITRHYESDSAAIAQTIVENNYDVVCVQQPYASLTYINQTLPPCVRISNIPTGYTNASLMEIMYMLTVS